MKSNKLRKICAIALTLALGMSVFAGCGKDNSVDSGRKLIYNLGSDPETIDPTLNTAAESGTIIDNAFEGLMRLDENEKAKPGVAEKMDVSDDKLVYTFKLRKDAKWSDGKDVTAKDFEYSWVRALTKETAAEYAYQFFYIKNAKNFYDGKAKREDLGIEVVDDHTLKVTLESPTDYFPELTAFTNYVPLREDIVSANPDTWATNPETYVSNGPFKLVQWDMKDQLIFEKNDNYWNKKEIKLPGIVYKLVTDQNTAYASLKSGEFDMVDTVPPAEIESGKNEGLVTIYPNLATYMLAFNVGKQDSISSPEVKKALSNKKVRQALSLAIDRKGIVEKVTKAGQVPAYSYVPKGILNSKGEEFASKEYFNPNQANTEEAKKLLAEAGYPNGEGLPTFEFMYNTEGSHKDIAQVIQQDWAKIGVKAELTNQEWKVFLNTRQQGGYQIARHGWNGDYVDPMTFLDLFETGGGNNDAGFSNAEYDKLLADARKETDANRRWELMRKAEDILMDEAPIIPLYYYTKVKGAKPEVKGVRVSMLGHVYFDKAYIEESK
ncbi:peptide ABC transporter substrate-binding protein [Clostridium perfringens]|uniref:Peptide ABC transporter substrate-binding protein n=1 Tax=Clostridium perfringens TaxID=1502 RepID=A0AAW9J3A9_CLOPF|nr:peptide ABC transporter substrate-binding protein [Clostridium perfringens]MDZ5033935.1 peptide ABC transporter substrate-binding protein [Clostridium perfringens]